MVVVMMNDDDDDDDDSGWEDAFANINNFSLQFLAVIDRLSGSKFLPARDNNFSFIRSILSPYMQTYMRYFVLKISSRSISVTSRTSIMNW